MAYPFLSCGLHVDIRPSYTITQAPVDRTLRRLEASRITLSRRSRPRIAAVQTDHRPHSAARVSLL
jgi:hypothetical protein